MMTVSSNTSDLVSLFVLLALLSTISGSWIDIYNGDLEKSSSGDAVNSRQERPGVCGVRPYDYLFDEPRQRSVYDALLRNVDDLKTQTDQKNIKIVGGNTAVHGEFPWQARTQLLYPNGEIAYPHDCGAVVISEHWLLSAAHCFDDGNTEYDVRIIVGDHSLEVNDEGEQAFDVERIINHEKFTPDSDYDIALIKIRPTNDGRGIQFNSFVQPACLPDSTIHYTEGTECLISGWGYVNQDIPNDPPVLVLSPNLLQGAKVPLIHQTVCKYLYSVSTPKYNVTERMICAGYVDGGVNVCHGDSGGPLVSKTEVKFQNDLNSPRQQEVIPVMTRIIGGYPADREKVPWQARLESVDTNGYVKHHCGAVIISEDWLLSAAHCVKYSAESNFRIHVGDYRLSEIDDEEQVFKVDSWKYHEQFGVTSEHDNDIALIKIRPRDDGRRIEFSRFVKPVILPNSTTLVKNGTDCFISGWGLYRYGIPPSPEVLQAGEVSIFKQQDCQKIYYNKLITDRMICAGNMIAGIGGCYGDSGGPLVCKIGGVDTIIGITSFTTDEQCGYGRTPTVYARVSALRFWIAANMES